MGMRGQDPPAVLISCNAFLSSVLITVGDHVMLPAVSFVSCLKFSLSIICLSVPFYLRQMIKGENFRQSVYNFHPDWNISKTIEGTDMQFGTDGSKEWHDRVWYCGVWLLYFNVLNVYFHVLYNYRIMHINTMFYYRSKSTKSTCYTTLPSRWTAVSATVQFMSKPCCPSSLFCETGISCGTLWLTEAFIA